MTDRRLAASDRAPAPRTLVDVITATAAAHTDAPAVDDTTTVLTYDDLLGAARDLATGLHAAGVRRGDTVGVRATSGHADLYVAVLGILLAGAAYVAVDADDPQERADLVFGEARVAAVVGARRSITVAPGGPAATDRPGEPLPAVTPDDDAWVIFTSGSTGVPKGVAVTHRSAAAFVDAEARIFLQDSPIGPGDRVLAGLSVAFDASCEEMWLAWGHGGCLVPAPRSLVRTGQDLGPWLVAQDITVVSTVPTLAALWPAEAFEPVRLLIFGGEACPPELAARLTVPGREVWNTYGPTEATVVACAAPMDGTGPIRIGLPLDGWDLAVVGADGRPVPEGETGELIIGGVGLARYLDPAKDAEKYAPMPTLGWERAYRSGDLVVHDPEGLLFVGRADEQVKLGGRRIELGEVDAALQALPDVTAAAAAVKTTPVGSQVLVGYLVPADPDAPYDRDRALARLREELPAALVPVLAVVDDLPTRTSGKVDRDALPWPLVGATGDDVPALPGTAGWVAGHWSAVLGLPVTDERADFFALGGGSLSSARLVSLLRERYPTVTVADVHAHPRLGALAELLDSFAPAEPQAAVDREVRRLPAGVQLLQTLVSLVLLTVRGLQWLVGLAVATEVLRGSGTASWPPPASWWAIGVGLLLRHPVGDGSDRPGLPGPAVAPAPAPTRAAARSGPAVGGRALRRRHGAVTMAGAPWIV
ncbi:amino acid adenylation domain-containing protein, partial [Lapillicoccus jejuensis]